MSISLEKKEMLERGLKAYLPKVFEGLPIQKSAFPYSKFNKNLVCWAEINPFGKFLNTYLTYAYLTGDKPDYRVITYYDYIQSIFDKEESQYNDVEFLVILFYGGQHTSVTQQFIESLLYHRKLYKLHTVACIDPTHFPESRFEEFFGSRVLDVIKSYSSLTLGKHNVSR